MAERYYWLKLQRDFFKRHDVRIVESMQNGKDYVLFYLKLLCESIDHEGRLRFSDSIPYNDEMLSTITNTNIDIVRSAVKIFTELGLMEILSDGTFFMNEVQKMIGSETSWAEKKREYRRTIQGQCEDNVLQLSDKSKSKNKSKSQSKNNNYQEENENDSNTLEDKDNVSWFLDAFNSIDGVVKCQNPNQVQKEYISLLFHTYSLSEIDTVFTNLRNSFYLLGKATREDGKLFHVTLDWFIEPCNFSLVFKGRFTKK